MLDHEALVKLGIGALFALWLASLIYPYYSTRKARRRRREQLDRLACTFDLTPDAGPQSNDRRELKAAYNDAVGQNWGIDGLYHQPAKGVGYVFAPGSIDILYQGHGLRLFQITQWTQRGSRTWIGLGVQNDGLDLPPFRRQRRGSFQIGLSAARQRGNLLDLPDGSFALLRDAADKAAIKEVFTQPVLSFLETRSDWEMAGKGHELWLSSTWDPTDEEIAATLLEAKRIFAS